MISFHFLLVASDALLSVCPQVLVQDPHRKWNAARAVTSAKSWKKIEAELKHSVRMISEQPDIGFEQLCEKGADEEDQEEEDGLTMDELIARLRM